MKVLVKIYDGVKYFRGSEKVNETYLHRRRKLENRGR